MKVARFLRFGYKKICESKLSCVLLPLYHLYPYLLPFWTEKCVKIQHPHFLNLISIESEDKCTFYALFSLIGGFTVICFVKAFLSLWCKKNARVEWYSSADVQNPDQIIFLLLLFMLIAYCLIFYLLDSAFYVWYIFSLFFSLGGQKIYSRITIWVTLK